MPRSPLSRPARLLDTVDGVADEIFSPSPPTTAPQPTPPPPRYFDADGDTVSTPEKAPAWLHKALKPSRAVATWRRSGDRVEVVVTANVSRLVVTDFDALIAETRNLDLDPDPTADPVAVVAEWKAQQRRRCEAETDVVQRVRSATQRPDIVSAPPLSRFDLLELDGAADPAVSIAEHKAQRQRRDEAEEAAKRRVAEMKTRVQPPSPVLPPAPPRRRLPDIIDASAVPTELQQLIVAGACLVAANEVTAN